jgi:septum formation protein
MPAPVRMHATLILASGSVIRQQMLRDAGLEFSVKPSGFDETALKPTLAHLPPMQQALMLAREKALAVSRAFPDAYTIGADQMCAAGDVILSKPGSYANAEAQLRTLSGTTHTQNCAAVIARGNDIVWEHAESATLTMRALTDAEIRAYVAADAPLQSCGAYKFEALGKHLFAQIEGDHHVIQGLPLIALLAKLHQLQAITLSA